MFSFKLRGAYNKMAHLSAAQLAKSRCCGSGNHAQALALAARNLVPGHHRNAADHASHQVDAVKARGAKVVLYGESYSDSYEHARSWSEGQQDIHPSLRRSDVIAGQGTIGMEILPAAPGRYRCNFVAVGGGGLISGSQRTSGGAPQD